MEFQHRSYQAELIDDPTIPFDEIKKNLKELDIINTWLGGHAISIQALQKIIKYNKNSDKNWNICEIGCGGGDNLRALASWCYKNNIRATFTGIDINLHCIEYANSQAYQQPISFIVNDYREIVFESLPDVIFNSLFCHHFTNKQVAEILAWMHQHSNSGFFINDLHRHPVAYYLIKYITKFFSSSRLVKNDAPLSVKRGFILSEWKKLLREVGLQATDISWKWAFRYLIVYVHPKKVHAGT